jgi:hypothetical protein
MAKNISERDLSDWVDERIGSLAGAPLPQVDATGALNRFDQMRSMLKRRRRARIWTMVTILASCGFLLTLPSTRGLAQRLWNRVFLSGGMVVVRTSQFEPVPQEYDYSWVAPSNSSSNQPVADIAEAAARAGFVPRLPAPELLEGLPPVPFLRVLNSEGTELTVRVADITARLQRAGISPADVQVPLDWDGVVLHFPGGRSILAIYDYGNTLHRAMIHQGPLDSGILVPAGFPLDKWIEIMLRTSGLSAAEAREQRNRFAENPFGILLIPPDYKGNVRPVFLKSGPAVLVENNNDDRTCLGCPHPGELALEWHAGDRTYTLVAAGVSQERAIEIANSMD